MTSVQVCVYNLTSSCLVVTGNAVNCGVNVLYPCVYAAVNPPGERPTPNNCSCTGTGTSTSTTCWVDQCQ